jgi:hypothetical protein
VGGFQQHVTHNTHVAQIHNTAVAVHLTSGA